MSYEIYSYRLGPTTENTKTTNKETTNNTHGSYNKKYNKLSIHPHLGFFRFLIKTTVSLASLKAGVFLR